MLSLGYSKRLFLSDSAFYYEGYTLFYKVKGENEQRHDSRSLDKGLRFKLGYHKRQRCRSEVCEEGHCRYGYHCVYKEIAIHLDYGIKSTRNVDRREHSQPTDTKRMTDILKIGIEF